VLNAAREVPITVTKKKFARIRKQIRGMLDILFWELEDSMKLLLTFKHSRCSTGLEDSLEIK
jgi:hypothetical protein